MKRYLAAFLLLGSIPPLVDLLLSGPSGRLAPLVRVAAALGAGLLTVLLARRLVQQLGALQAELEGERLRKSRFEAHSREMYEALERKLEARTAEMARQRDILVRTEKLAALSRLVAGVAHGLNNPLMAIMGEALILRQRCAQPDLANGLELIEHQARRCAALVRDLVAFARAEQRQVQPLDVHALLESALAQAALAAPAQQVEVLRQYWPEPLVVTGNMEQLQQALANVIANAYQAMAGEASGRLTLRSQRIGGGLRLEVADSGPGIEPAVLPYIFDPFFSRRANARGLGLSVALGLVQGHGGRIWAESQAGRGTRVVIELPCTG